MTNLAIHNHNYEQFVNILETNCLSKSVVAL